MAKTSFAQTIVSIAPAAADVYTVEILTVKEGRSKAGNSRVYIETEVKYGARTEDSQEGCTISDGFNLPTTGDEKMDDMMLRMWMEFFVSVGYDQSEIRKKGFDFEKMGNKKAFEYLIGRTGFVKYTPADPDEGRKWANRKWLTEAQAGAYSDARAEIKEAANVSDDDDNDPLGSFLNG